MEFIEVNWSCKQMEKTRSSKAAILALNWVKQNFPLWVLLTFSWIELPIMVRCCLIHIIIIIMRHILYLAYLCPCLCLGLFISYLCVLFFIFSLTFIVINHITLLRQTHLFFVPFLEHILLFFDDNEDEKAN